MVYNNNKLDNRINISIINYKNNKFLEYYLKKTFENNRKTLKILGFLITTLLKIFKKLVS